MNIIPKPKSIKINEGTFDASLLTSLEICEELNGCKTIADKLISDIGSKSGGCQLVIKQDENLASEAYKLEITKSGVTVYASTSAGAIWALQTLRVISLADVKNAERNILCCTIADEPKFGWRGLLIDEARYFLGEEHIKQVIDMMSLHKLNVLHWHLTDDQGWRIEIKKYPLLTQIGGKRAQSGINGWHRADSDGKPHSGWYTQEQILDIVKYAADRGVSIMPEIDMPAHFAAAFAAYPELACRDIKRDVPWYFGSKAPLSQGIKDWNRAACLGNEKTVQFIFDVVDEVCELFPFGYYHIGGDEVPTEEWEKCPRCNALMKEKGLANTDEMHAYFNNRLVEYLKTKGKRCIAWNEVLRGKGLDKSVVAQYWVPNEDRNVAKHLQRGGEVVMSKHQSFYFDMPYSLYPLRNTYKFTPYISGIKPKYSESIKGVEAAVWREWIPDNYKLQFMLFPRMEALAETAWSWDKDWKDFLSRLERFLPILDANGVNYAEEEIWTHKKNLFKRAKITNNFYGGDQNMELRRNSEIKREKK